VSSSLDPARRHWNVIQEALEIIYFCFIFFHSERIYIWI